MKIEQLLLLEMKLANIIKDDDNMDWTSPDNQFMFTIKRYDTTFGIDNPNLIISNEDSRYLIELSIKDIVGVEIIKIYFSELDTIRILDSMNTFLFDFECQTYSDISIYLDPNNGRLETNIIYLLRDDINPYYNNPYFVNEMRGINRDIRFELRKYCPTQESIIPILTFYASNEELTDFMFIMYFCILIDLDVPPEYISSIESIVQNLVDYGYINGGDY